jgi:hypothetical protein
MSRPRRDDWTIEVFDSFEEAEAAERRHRLAMTGEERLRITESLRATYYGYAESGIQPRLERTLASVPLA